MQDESKIKLLQMHIFKKIGINNLPNNICNKIIVYSFKKFMIERGHARSGAFCTT